MTGLPTGMVRFRLSLPGDDPFVYASWLKGAYYGNDFFEEIEKDIFFSVYKRVVKNLLARPAVEVRVACLSDDPDVVLGYAVTELVEGSEVLHWVFVKRAWRRQGLARQLLGTQTRTVTHLTHLGASIKPKEWVFNPFLI